MVNTLVAFGCSNTFGSESIAANDNNNPQNIYHSYTYFLSKKLNIPNYLNYAWPGHSNLEIAYTVFKYIFNNDCKNIFIVIGWTGDNRFAFYYDGKHHSVKLRKQNNIIEQKLQSILDRGCTNIKIRDMMIDQLHESSYKFSQKYQWKDDILFLFTNLLTSYFFNTQLCTTLNIAIKFGITAILEKLNIKYITLPTILYTDHPSYQLLNSQNNIFAYKNGTITFDYNNFRHARKTGHLASHEHEQVALWIYNYMQSAKYFL